METKGRIWNIQRFNIHDGEGIRTMVFFKGCPLHCIWCANPEGISPNRQLKFNAGKCTGCGECVKLCSANSFVKNGIEVDRKKCRARGECVSLCKAGARELLGRETTVREILGETEKDAPFYYASGGGLTLSGGEALLQRDFVLELLQAAYETFLSVTIETCGDISWKTFDAAAPMVDTFLFDLKAWDPELHEQLTGRPNQRILKNACALCKTGARIIFRTPVVPGCNDSEENIRGIGKFLREIGADKWELLPYHQLGMSKYRMLGMRYELQSVPVPSDVQMAQYLTWAKEEHKGAFFTDAGGDVDGRY